jgi:large subunit ribosomal protein L6
MSKIGKAPITIPSTVTLDVTPDTIHVRTDRGLLAVTIPNGIRVTRNENILQFELVGTSKQAKSNWGTVRALVQNAITGLTAGFSKTLILEGVGYRILKEGTDLVFTIGFSHPVRYAIPRNVTCEIEKNTILTIRGFDRALVGQTAAEIRAKKKPEPYKGTGFRYSDEVIKRKAGKKAAAASGGA